MPYEKRLIYESALLTEILLTNSITEYYESIVLQRYITVKNIQAKQPFITSGIILLNRKFEGLEYMLIIIRLIDSKGYDSGYDKTKGY